MSRTTGKEALRPIKLVPPAVCHEACNSCYHARWTHSDVVVVVDFCFLLGTDLLVLVSASLLSNVPLRAFAHHTHTRPLSL